MIHSVFPLTSCSLNHAPCPSNSKLYLQSAFGDWTPVPDFALHVAVLLDIFCNEIARANKCTSKLRKSIGYLTELQGRVKFTGIGCMDSCNRNIANFWREFTQFFNLTLWKFEWWISCREKGVATTYVYRSGTLNMLLLSELNGLRVTEGNGK